MHDVIDRLTSLYSDIITSLTRFSMYCIALWLDKSKALELAFVERVYKSLDDFMCKHNNIDNN